MAIQATYRTGTATVNKNGTVVTFAGGANLLSAGVQAEDRFWAAGFPVRILSVDSATQLTLAYPWMGDTRSADVYEIIYAPDTSRVQATTQQLLTTLSDGKLASMAAQAMAADQMLYSTGPTTFAATPLTAFARTILDDLTAAAVRATINAQAALGYTPFNKAGDTITGQTSLTFNNAAAAFPSLLIYNAADGQNAGYFGFTKFGSGAAAYGPYAPGNVGLNTAFTDLNLGTETGHALSLYSSNSKRLVVESGGTVRPGADNAYTLGSSAYRFSTIYAATGTINTSDKRDKKRQRAIKGPEALEIVKAVPALLYRWRVGARTVEQVQATDAGGAPLYDDIDVPETERVEVAVERTVEEWGATKVVREMVSQEQPVTVLAPVVDADGKPVMEEVEPAQEEQRDRDGEVMRPARPAVMRQRMIEVPKTRRERRPRMIEKLTDVPGKRLHAGFFAQDVADALKAVEIDCGAWLLDDPADPESRQAVRPDQMMAFLWAAVGELSARLDKATKAA